jgi:hypothetical protein
MLVEGDIFDLMRSVLGTKPKAFNRGTPNLWQGVALDRVVRESLWASINEFSSSL